MKKAFFILCLMIGASTLYAESFTLDLGTTGGNFMGRLVQIFAITSLLGLAPAIVITLTSYTRIIIVFSFLRNALGTQQSPPNMVLASLALFLTLFVMGPTLQKSYNEGVAPFMENKITEMEAFEKTIGPVRLFMLKNVREKDLKLFFDLGKVEVIDPSSTPLTILIPAFIISEVRRAFEIGFLIFIPFLIIDMVVASILMAMGMMMLPPVMIAMPFKIIFFVLVDGWGLMCGSLINSFKS